MATTKLSFSKAPALEVPHPRGNPNNWIGWMNMENFITGYPSREFQIRDELLKVIGKEKYDVFFDSVFAILNAS
jgi:hypothetical protein